jgi:hypothetical protein
MSEFNGNYRLCSMCGERLTLNQNRLCGYCDLLRDIPERALIKALVWKLRKRSITLEQFLKTVSDQAELFKNS